MIKLLIWFCTNCGPDIRNKSFVLDKILFGTKKSETIIFFIIPKLADSKITKENRQRIYTHKVSKTRIVSKKSSEKKIVNARMIERIKSLKEAYKTNRSIIEIALEKTDLSKSQLLKILDPKKLV